MLYSYANSILSCKTVKRRKRTTAYSIFFGTYTNVSCYERQTKAFHSVLRLQESRHGDEENHYIMFIELMLSGYSHVLHSYQSFLRIGILDIFSLIEITVEWT